MWTHARADGKVDVHRCMNSRTHGRTDARTDGCTDGWMDAWMDTWMDGQTGAGEHASGCLIVDYTYSRLLRDIVCFFMQVFSFSLRFVGRDGCKLGQP